MEMNEIRNLVHVDWKNLLIQEGLFRMWRCYLPGCPSPILSEFLDEEEEGGVGPLEGLLLLLRLEDDDGWSVQVREGVLVREG